MSFNKAYRHRFTAKKLIIFQVSDIKKTRVVDVYKRQAFCCNETVLSNIEKTTVLNENIIISTSKTFICLKSIS